MKKENLLKLAEGHKLIAEAFLAQAEELAEEKASNKNKPTSKAQEAPEQDEEEEGYSLAELASKRVTELKKIADDLGIEYDSKIKKDDLIDLIMDGEEPAEQDEDEEEEDDSELTEDDINEMSLSELKALADDYEIEYAKNVKVAALRKLILEELADPEEDESEEGEITVDDLAEMELDELKELADENGIKYTKATKAPALRKKLEEALFADEEEEEEETDIAEELGLNDMSLDELAEILEEYELPTKGKKQALISRIVKGVEDGVIEFED